MKINTFETDLLVIGSGISGLRAAVAAAEKGIKVLVVSKGPSASPEIMGFNAPVLPGDSEELYFEDLEKSGYGINDSRLARILSEKVLGEVEWLENHGVHFARDENGVYSPIHTLGTKFPRLIRSGISSGVTEMNAFKKICGEMGIEIRIPVDILDLIMVNGRVCGAWGIENNEPVCYFAKAVVLAAGGCGAIQSFTTYPKAIIGDGYAMAYDAGATLVDMEIQQFEPCCFVYPESIRGMVIATTLLRHGAELRNGNGEPFMHNYGLSRENAQKGSLSRAMLAEVRAGRGTPHGGIYYDMTMFDADFLYKDHAIFTRPAVNAGLDLTKEMPEMMPAAHTNLGGVVIDGSCGTGIDGLFACGEVIGGLHGGNRLGGCAGAETVVFGHIAGDSAAEYVCGNSSFLSDSERDGALSSVCDIIDSLMKSTGKNNTANIKTELGLCLTDNLGIARNGDTISKAADTVARLSSELSACGAQSAADVADIIHCRHMITLASMQIKASDMRKESRGVYYREDYPNTDNENWRKNILIHRGEQGMEFTVRDAIDADRY